MEVWVKQVFWQNFLGALRHIVDHQDRDTFMWPSSDVLSIEG